MVQINTLTWHILFSSQKPLLHIAHHLIPMMNSDVEGVPRGWRRGEGTSDDVEGVPDSMRKSPVPEYEPEDAAPTTKKKRVPSDKLATAKKAGAAIISGIRKAGQFARETAPKVGKAIQTTRETAAKYAPAHPSGSKSPRDNPFGNIGSRGHPSTGGFGIGMGMQPSQIFGGFGSMQQPAPPSTKSSKKKKKVKTSAQHPTTPEGHNIFGGMQTMSRPEQFLGPVRGKAKKPEW